MNTNGSASLVGWLWIAIAALGLSAQPAYAESTWDKLDHGVNVVIGRVLGLPCNGAAIEGDPHERTGGYARVGYGWLLSRERTDARELVEASIVMTMGGAVAESVLLGRQQESDRGYESDLEHTSKLAKSVRWPGR